MRNLLMRDYRRIVEITRESGAEVIFVTDSFEALHKTGHANNAMRNIGKDLDIPVISLGEAVMRVPEEERAWRWMAHPGSEINREIARARPEKTHEDGDS